MSRVSRRMNRESAIRANNKKVSKKVEKSNFQQNCQHTAEKERLLEKYGRDKHTMGDNGNNALW